ncbi:uncharacterized protein LOC123697064 [Colias croceus]|uniref:uncharacterized protein LOC123697064 n=1 Tax=Colias crocea TaxID=72248 RepID=UPI001E27AECF|nr:uncharacterized protein LOC123697064 [Colias croceus]
MPPPRRYRAATAPLRCVYVRDRTAPAPTPHRHRAAIRHCVSVPITNHLELLGITLTPTLNFGSFIESKAQVASKKLGILAKVRQYFSPGQLLNLYQAQVRSCMEYCSHLWDGSAKYQLEALEAIERRAKRLINDDDLVGKKLQSLGHRRRVASLSVFYRIHFGEVKVVSKSVLLRE